MNDFHLTAEGEFICNIYDRRITSGQMQYQLYAYVAKWIHCLFE